MSGREWDPQQYLRFRAERARPARDLADLVRPVEGMRWVDLGCGTGELTAELHRRFAAGEGVGVDRSETMLERARPLAADGLRFEGGDLVAWKPASPVDLVFSNAALHWVDDHPKVFARLTAMLAPRGQLAVQMPANFDQPSHRIPAELAGEEPWAELLGGRRRGARVLAPETYAILLHDQGIEDPLVRLQVYLHLLPGPEAVFEWIAGSTLTWYRRELGEESYARFAAICRERLLRALPDRRPFPYPFKRLLLWGRLGDGERQPASPGITSGEAASGPSRRSNTNTASS